MFRRATALLIVAIASTGCDRLTGAAEQKVSDAEAIGYACRVAAKQPEDCMKENDSKSPSSILLGWKAADKDIVDKTLDPSMGKDSASAEPPATDAGAQGDQKTAGDGATSPDQTKAAKKKSANQP